VSTVDDAVQALNNSTALTAKVGTRFFYDSPPMNAVLPCVSYYTSLSKPAEYADNSLTDRETTLIIEVWTKNESPTAIADIVDSALLAAGFSWVYSQDMPGGSDGVYQKLSKYKQVKEV